MQMSFEYCLGQMFEKNHINPPTLLPQSALKTRVSLCANINDLWPSNVVKMHIDSRGNILIITPLLVSTFVS